MSKIWFALLLLVLMPVFAIGTAHSEDFYENVLISTDIKLEETADNAKDKASALLDSQAPVIKIDGAPSTLPFRFEQQDQEIDTLRTTINHASTGNITTKYGDAPFGLPWGGTYNQVKSLGVTLVRHDIKDLPNSFWATTLPKTLPYLNQVIISFGENNLLWKITAYSNMLDDTPSASNILQIYHKYYKLLEQKYGNAQQFFTPKITIIEKTIKDENDRETIETTRIEEPIGGKNFLAELQSGEAVLYATFENQKVGAAMSVNVDGNGKSYIIIDFTNLEIFKEREEQVLNAL